MHNVMKPDAANRPRLLLADDHTILLDAFRRLLEPAYDVVGAVTNGRALVEAALHLKPDAIVADIGMPQLNGLDACEELTRQLPQTRLIFLTVNEDPDIAAEAIRRGAAGFLLKKAAASELFTALERVLSGRFYITPAISTEPPAVFVARAQHGQGSQKLSLRQREVLQLLADGRSMKEAADLLKISPSTIAFHKYTMMKQLGLKTSAELVQYAIRIGLVDDHPEILRQVARLLSGTFQVVDALSDGSTLRRAVTLHHPELVVLDISLPGASGLELARELARLDPPPKVVFLTVHADSDYAREAFATGALGYVVKPRLATDLVPALRAAVAGTTFVSPCPELEEFQ